jgi:hypothetical protein
MASQSNYDGLEGLTHHKGTANEWFEVNGYAFKKVGSNPGRYLIWPPSSHSGLDQRPDFWITKAESHQEVYLKILFNPETLRNPGDRDDNGPAISG